MRPSSSRLAAVADTAALIVLRDRARDLAKQDDALAWLAVARAACDVTPALPELPGVLAACAGLEALATRRRDRRGRTAGDLATDVAALGDALSPLDPLLAYRLVVGGEDGPETWAGTRQRNRPRALVWGDAVAVGEVVLLDGAGHIALRLTPLVRAQRPLPHGDLELFLIARSGKGVARLAATPWGFEHDDEEAGRFLAQLSTADSSSLEEIDDERSPYPGLAAYGVDDADRFFGREREIDALANRLVRAPMVAVVGPSGVGKSSFVHAGLSARLREHYRVVAMRPGRHPTDALHAAIEREASPSVERSETDPERGGERSEPPGPPRGEARQIVGTRVRLAACVTGVTCSCASSGATVAASPRAATAAARRSSYGSRDC